MKGTASGTSGGAGGASVSQFLTPFPCPLAASLRPHGSSFRGHEEWDPRPCEVRVPMASSQRVPGRGAGHRSGVPQTQIPFPPCATWGRHSPSDHTQPPGRALKKQQLWGGGTCGGYEALWRQPAGGSYPGHYLMGHTQQAPRKGDQGKGRNWAGGLTTH